MIDSHVHLDAKNYEEGGGVAEILQAAASLGVDRMVCPSLHLESFERLRALAAQFPARHAATLPFPRFPEAPA